MAPTNLRIFTFGVSCRVGSRDQMAEEARRAVDSVVGLHLADRDWVVARSNGVRTRYYQLVRDVVLPFSIIADLCTIICEYAPMRKMMIVTPPPLVRPTYRSILFGSDPIQFGLDLQPPTSGELFGYVSEIRTDSHTIHIGRSRSDMTKCRLLAYDSQAPDLRYPTTRIQLPNFPADPQVFDNRFIAVNTGETQLCVDLSDTNAVFERATENIASATDFDRRELVDYIGEYAHGNGIHRVVHRVVLNDGSETGSTPLCNLTVHVHGIEFYPVSGTFRMQNNTIEMREMWFKIEWRCGGSAINDIIRLADWTLVSSSSLIVHS